MRASNLGLILWAYGVDGAASKETENCLDLEATWWSSTCAKPWTSRDGQHYHAHEFDMVRVQDGKIAEHWNGD